jgi:hypothetical protein
MPFLPILKCADAMPPCIQIVIWDENGIHDPPRWMLDGAGNVDVVSALEEVEAAVADLNTRDRSRVSTAQGLLEECTAFAGPLAAELGGQADSIWSLSLSSGKAPSAGTWSTKGGTVTIGTATRAMALDTAEEQKLVGGAMDELALDLLILNKTCEAAL